ncbi:hypothetical protein [Nostoc sp. C117]|uniref:hypothetical protein n=1 Tax=Nostoc sp. C117 TaxID=3349875 RepID=UPI00370D45DF
MRQETTSDPYHTMVFGRLDQIRLPSIARNQKISSTEYLEFFYSDRTAVNRLLSHNLAHSIYGLYASSDYRSSFYKTR